jgi:hypothetical protein
LILVIFTGCAQKIDNTAVPPEAEVSSSGVQHAAAGATSNKKSELSPPGAIPVAAADKRCLEDAAKLGATVYEGQNGGYELRIEANTEPEPILAVLRETRCIVGLTIEGEKLTDAALRYAGGFTHLEQLTIHRCPNLSGAGFDSLRKLEGLRSVAVSECPIDNAACLHIGQIKSLEEIRLIRTRATDSGVQAIATLPALEALSLEGSPVGGGAFSAPGWPKLRDIEAQHTTFDDKGLRSVAGLRELRSLRVDSSRITDAGLAQLGTVTELLDLSLSGTKVTDTGLAHLASLSHLRTLDISSTAIRGSGFAAFPNRPALRKLSASGSLFQDSAAAHLVKFPGLTLLALSETSVTDNGMTSLDQLKRLAKCDLSGTSVGDATAHRLSTFTALEDVGFANTRLTDAGLAALAASPTIRCIDARETKVTKDGAARAKLGRTRFDIRLE